MTHTHAFSRSVLAIAAGLWLCGSAVSAYAQTAAVLYQRATDREAALRAASTPTPSNVRRTIAAYELVVRRFPQSGYCDNALWQASGVALLTFRQSNSEADRADGERLLKWLSTQYPTSPFAKQADERLRAFAATGASVVAAGPAASASAPTRIGGGASRSEKTTATLRAVSRQPLPGGDRIVIEVDREVVYSSERVASPDRVLLDLSSTALGNGIAASVSALTGMLVTGARLAHPAPGTTRLEFDLAGAPKHSIYPLYNPYRLIIDAEGPPPPPITKSIVQEPVLNSAASAAAPAPPMPPAQTITPAPDHPAVSAMPATTVIPVASGPSVPPSAKPAVIHSVVPLPPPSTMRGGDYSLARQLGLGVQRIVIDAGHGGHDPGAQANGVTEKDLVLDVALRLRALLQEQPGIDVVLTRDTDEFIPLEERTAIANHAGADLFLSIHANASRRKDARGIETYFLNFATNLEAEAVAARENAASSQSMGQLPEILKAIALNTKLAESRELATMVQTSMVRRLKTQSATVRDLGVKQAPFVVLIGAQMPSVLAEISFVTNRTDAAALKKDATKQRIAQSLYDAIVKYQTSLKQVTTTARKDNRR